MIEFDPIYIYAAFYWAAVFGGGYALFTWLDGYSGPSPRNKRRR